METFLGTSLVAPFCHIDRHHALVEERRSSVGHVLSEELQVMMTNTTINLLRGISMMQVLSLFSWGFHRSSSSVG
jgi:hypothetical protein